MSYLSVLTHPGLKPALAATLLSRLSARMLSLALVLYALSRFASPAMAGWLAFALIAPGLVISPLAGALLDRLGPGRAVVLDMAASAALLAGLAAADALGAAAPGLVFALVGALSLTSPLSAAGVRTLLPRLVPPEALDRVNALDTAIYAVVDVAGPALAGVLVALAGGGRALAAIALCYALAALCMARIAVPAGQGVRTGSLLAQAVAGVRLVLTQPTLRGLAISYSLYQMSAGVFVVVVPVVIARHVAAADSATGLAWALMGLAGGAGALLAGHLSTTGREGEVMAGGMLLAALAAWPVAAFGLPGLGVALVLAGLVAGPIDVGLLTLRQRRTPPAQLGRVLSVSISLNIAGFPLGSALAGMLVDISLPATLGLACLAALAGAAATRLIPRDN